MHLGAGDFLNNRLVGLPRAMHDIMWGRMGWEDSAGDVNVLCLRFASTSLHNLYATHAN